MVCRDSFTRFNIMNDIHVNMHTLKNKKIYTFYWALFIHKYCSLMNWFIFLMKFLNLKNLNLKKFLKSTMDKEDEQREEKGKKHSHFIWDWISADKSDRSWLLMIYNTTGYTGQSPTAFHCKASEKGCKLEQVSVNPSSWDDGLSL